MKESPDRKKKKTKDNSITHDILRTQDDSIMCKFYCITFIEYMLA